MGRRVTTIELFCTIYTGMGSADQIQTIALCPQHHGSPAAAGCALLGAEAALQSLQQQAQRPAQDQGLHGGGGGHRAGEAGAVHSPGQGVSVERCHA